MPDASAEIVITVDRDNRITGSAARDEVRRRNLIHRACYILVFNPHGLLFIHRRSASKDLYPGCWDSAVGGIVLHGESYRESAVRELDEELSISGVRLDHHFDHYFETPTNRVWGAIFSCCHPGPFRLQPEEIDTGHFANPETIRELSSRQPFAPDGLAILARFLNQEVQPHAQNHLPPRP